MYTQLKFDFPPTALDLALSEWGGNALPFIEKVKKRIEDGEPENHVVRDEVYHIWEWAQSLVERCDAQVP